MKTLFCLLLFVCTTAACQSPNTPMNQQKAVGGPCNGCEAIYEYGKKDLNAVDTLPGFARTQPQIKISGTVFHHDGKTPAAGVVLYLYHTNRQGIYKNTTNEKGWGRYHGSVRGWIQTDQQGQYTFYTFRPAPYPESQTPEHIHITVKEPDKKEYYLDDYFFDDDPFLTKAERRKRSNRGGSGIIQLSKEDGILSAKRDIILGLNIPNYPK